MKILTSLECLLPHDVFVELVNKKQIGVLLNTKVNVGKTINKATFAADIPAVFGVALNSCSFWLYVEWVVFIGAIICSFLYYWWLFIPGLILMYGIHMWNKERLTHVILSLCLVDSTFYRFLSMEGCLVFIFKNIELCKEMFAKYPHPWPNVVRDYPA